MLASKTPAQALETLQSQTDRLHLESPIHLSLESPVSIVAPVSSMRGAGRKQEIVVKAARSSGPDSQQEAAMMNTAKVLYTDIQAEPNHQLGEAERASMFLDSEIGVNRCQVKPLNLQECRQLSDLIESLLAPQTNASREFIRNEAVWVASEIEFPFPLRILYAEQDAMVSGVKGINPREAGDRNQHDGEIWEDFCMPQALAVLVLTEQPFESGKPSSSQRSLREIVDMLVSKHRVGIIEGAIRLLVQHSSSDSLCILLGSVLGEGMPESDSDVLRKIKEVGRVNVGIVISTMCAAAVNKTKNTTSSTMLGAASTIRS